MFIGLISLTLLSSLWVIRLVIHEFCPLSSSVWLILRLREVIKEFNTVPLSQWRETVKTWTLWYSDLTELLHIVVTLNIKSGGFWIGLDSSEIFLIFQEAGDEAKQTLDVSVLSSLALSLLSDWGGVASTDWQDDRWPSTHLHHLY